MTSEASTQAILAALTRFERGQAELNADVSGLSNRMDRFEQRLDRVEAGQSRLRVEVMARLDRRQDLLTRMRDDIGVNMGRVDPMHRANENTREELRTLHQIVFAVGRQISNIRPALDGLQSRS